MDQSDPNFKKTEAFDQILSKRKIKATQLIHEEKMTPQQTAKQQNTKSWMSLVRKVKDTAGEQDRKGHINNKLMKETKFNTNKKFKR